MPRHSFYFSDYVLDMDKRRLLRHGSTVDLEDKPLDVLHALASRPGRILSEQELLTAVWKTTAVEKTAVTTAIHKVRKALAIERGLVRNVRRKGYVLTAKVLAPVTAGSLLAEKLRTLNWIGYEPIGYDPAAGHGPALDVIRQDLSVLRQAGLDGLITFRGEDTLADIPRIAREVGFEGVIMGFRTDQEDLVSIAKSSAEWVDSFCLGHNEPPSESMIDLMEAVRSTANRPVTSTWFLDASRDPAYEAVATACDWFLPDIGVIWRDGYESADRQIADLKAKIDTAATLARSHKAVVMLKMVSFPSGGRAGYTEAKQQDFLTRVLRYYRSSGYPHRASVFLSYFSAFNIEWKNKRKEYSPCERHLGLFDSDRRPKMAARSFASDRPPKMAARTFAGPRVYLRRDH